MAYDAEGGKEFDGGEAFGDSHRNAQNENDQTRKKQERNRFRQLSGWRMMRFLLLALFLVPHFAASRTLSVCDALGDLSELNGKEVQIRGIWLEGDSVSILWASPDCPHPVIRDGWVWLSEINVGPDDIRNFIDLGYSMARLKKENPGKLLMITFTGILRTRDHFKINPSSRLPIGYGYSVAVLVFSKAENLEMVSLDSGEQSRLMHEAQFPQPRKVRKSR